MTACANQSMANRSARRPVVLVVEDETLLRITTAEYLRLSGYAVIEAADAAEAVVAFASREPVDIVFSDVHLPGAMDGLKLARWVHRHHRDIPVMLTSGHGDATHTAGLVGDEYFTSKPYRQKELAGCLRFLLEKTMSNSPPQPSRVGSWQPRRRS
jgi:two-component system, response regulator PdtaR